MIGTECRASAGVCDLAEVCTGSSASCPVKIIIIEQNEIWFIWFTFSFQKKHK